MKKNTLTRALLIVFFLKVLIHPPFTNAIFLNEFKAKIKEYISIYIADIYFEGHGEKLREGFVSYVVKRYPQYPVMSEEELNKRLNTEIQKTWDDYQNSDDIMKILSD